MSEDITTKAALLEVLNKSLADDISTLLDAILWHPFAEDDETLEIDRAVAERIKKLHLRSGP